MTDEDIDFSTGCKIENDDFVLSINKRIDIEEVKRLALLLHRASFTSGTRKGLSSAAAEDHQKAFDNLINYIQERI